MKRSLFAAIADDENNVPVAAGDDNLPLTTEDIQDYAMVVEDVFATEGDDHDSRYYLQFSPIENYRLAHPQFNRTFFLYSFVRSPFTFKIFFSLFLYFFPEDMSLNSFKIIPI